MMPRLRIRHLMILIAYVAVSLTVMKAAGDTRGPHRVENFLQASILTPFLLSGVSILMLKPGPGRDWLVAFFWTVSNVFLVLYIYPLLLIALPYQVHRPPVGALLVMLAIVVFCGLLHFAIAISLGRTYLLPAHCPHCGKKRLLRAALQHMANFQHVRCGICDREDYLALTQRIKGCPICHRRSFLSIRYQFYWCLNCCSRVKRLRRGNWENASSVREDRSFFLWSFGGSLRCLIDRIVKKGTERRRR